MFSHSFVLQWDHPLFYMGATFTSSTMSMKWKKNELCGTGGDTGGDMLPPSFETFWFAVFCVFASVVQFDVIHITTAGRHAPYVHSSGNAVCFHPIFVSFLVWCPLNESVVFMTLCVHAFNYEFVSCMQASIEDPHSSQEGIDYSLRFKAWEHIAHEVRFCVF